MFCLKIINSRVQQTRASSFTWITILESYLLSLNRSFHPLISDQALFHNYLRYPRRLAQRLKRGNSDKREEDCKLNTTNPERIFRMTSKEFPYVILCCIQDNPYIQIRSDLLFLHFVRDSRPMRRVPSLILKRL